MKKILMILMVIVIAITGYLYYEYNVNKIEFVSIQDPIALVETNQGVHFYESEKNNLDYIEKSSSQYFHAEYFDTHPFEYHYDSSNQWVTVIGNEYLLDYDISQSIYYINEERINFEKPPFILENKELYFEKDFLKDFFEISIFIKENKDLIIVDHPSYNVMIGEVNADEYLYYSKDNEDQKIKALTLKEEFTLYPVSEAWFFGYNEDFEFGYLKKSSLEIEKTVLETEKRESANEKILLAWDQVYSNSIGRRDIEPMRGLDIISPTWFKVIDSKGNYSSHMNKEYIQWAREEGYQVWPLISNTFGDIQMTSEFLNNYKSRRKLIKDFLALCKAQGFKGINIDFENVYLKDKDVLTQLIHEFKYFFGQEEILVSADVTVIGSSETWSRCYDRRRIGEIVDYMMVMTYDQHWASSPVSGTVSGHQWVKESLEEIIKIVDSNKIIMGIPLYTRIWYETPSKSQVNTMEVSSKAITMKGQNNILNRVNRTLIWDETSKQFYLAYIEDNVVKKIWIEDEVSIKEKAKLVNTLDLAGAALWSRGFETQNIWDVLTDELGD